MNPTKEFRDYLISQGAALVGIGDLTAVPSSDYPGSVLQSQSRYRNTSSKVFSLLQQENTTNFIIL